MNNEIWVIKVKYDNGDINFNEAYTTLPKCLTAIENKFISRNSNYEITKRTSDIVYLNSFTIKDNKTGIIYEAKSVTIYE